ncbi:hypothetical protein MKS88_004016 [Plasmodium brasilianum]|uniref:Uncharacterized protein n=1 Tax=Plasmodium brasilianum TaxID=5824 RepID=A0ACB9Y620_PLABR|nr:hypothetical protein MKS88_004016 [Plasmodium brasilianum]
MGHKSNIIIFIKIAELIILTWISNFSNYVCTSGKSKDGNCKYDRKIDIKRYRLLEKYKHDKDSNNILLKKRFPNGEIDKQKDITHNEKVTKRKNKKSNKSLLNKSQYYTENIDYNNEIFDGKHFHFEKKWIKKRNYYDLIEKKRRFRSISLKSKITYKINCNVGRCIHNTTLYGYNGPWDTYHYDRYPIFDKNLEDILQ